MWHVVILKLARLVIKVMRTVLFFWERDVLLILNPGWICFMDTSYFCLTGDTVFTQTWERLQQETQFTAIYVMFFSGVVLRLKWSLLVWNTNFVFPVRAAGSHCSNVVLCFSEILHEPLLLAKMSLFSSTSHLVGNKHLKSAWRGSNGMTHTVQSIKEVVKLSETDCNFHEARLLK